MITEDYVSFETAKLLKEKGFECEKDSVTAMYNEVGKFLSLSTAADEYYYDYNDFDEYDYVAPTLQMAMKWLREVHNIIITVRLFNSAAHFYLGASNQFTVDIATTTRSSQKGHIRTFYSTYEEACEAAIKYCLENLI